MKNLATLILFLIPLCLLGQKDLERFKEFQEAYEKALKVHEDSAFRITKKYLNTFTSSSFNKKLKKHEADHYYVSGQRKLADSIYKTVLPLYKAEKDYNSLFKILNRQGLFYFQTGKLKRGLEYANEVQDFIDTHKAELQSREYQIEIAELYRIIGIIYAIQAESDDTFNQETSEAYFKKAYRTLVPLKEYELEGLVLFNIGNIMTSKDSTIYYWNKALDVFDTNKLEHKKGNVYQNLAILYIDTEEYEKGITYLDLTTPYVEGYNDPYSTSLLNIKYGKAYLGLRQYQKSISKTETGLKIAQQYEMTSLVGEAYELLIQAYQKTSRYKLALDTYVKYDTLVKQLDRIETERIFRETEAKYKTKEQQDQIELLKQTELLKNSQIRQQQLIIGLVIIAFLLILLLSYFFWKQSKQRKKMNAQLVKLNKDRTRFLVNISHELRTPVTLIHGPLQDTFEQLEKKDLNRVQRNLHKISNNAQKLLQLTDEVLDISKLDEGFLKINTRSVNLVSFVSRTFFAFESLAIRNKIEWKAQIDIPEGNYAIDDYKLEKILNNLLSNAIKHTPKKGQVFFTAKIQNSILIAHVKDSGKGISEEALPKIFDRYYQDDTQENPASGIGIGLSLVKELVDVLKGGINVRSTLGKGTEFTVEIPVQKSDQKAVEKEVHLPVIDTENRPDIDLSTSELPHILVIEDHIEMADFIQQLLADEYRVSLASNGVEGIQRLQSDQYDLITVDVMMPEMNGIEFVTKIKEHPDWKSISTIMITALSEETDKITGLKLGVDDYIPKPFSGNELKARVENLIQNSQVRKETQLEESTDEIVGTEKEFLNKAKQIVESHINNNQFSVKLLASSLNLSERQTNRVLKKITGLSSLQFIREVRLQKAYHFLQTRKHATIAEISYAVGFENASYFTRIFTKRFGKKPSEML